MPGVSRKQRMHSQDRGHKKQKRYRSVSPSQPQSTRKRFKQSLSQEELDRQTELRTLKLKVDFLTAQVKLIHNQLHISRSQTHEREDAHQKSFCIIV